ncbi:MAG: type I restriction endonuclease subunit R [Lacunisphaera sp.]|nr:type I restriction endonuclease subunit R [Lacunisphaera sp.]
MPNAYTEDQLVEQPAIGLFAELGWQTVSVMEEVFGPSGSIGRETTGEVVLVPKLKVALEQLNPGVPPGAIQSAVDALTRDRSAMGMVAANREIYSLLKEGVSVSLPDQKQGGQRTERLRVVDWSDQAANDFLLVSQMTITGPLYTCRPDLIGFVNGLPLVVIELKKPGVPAKQAFDENLTSYKHPQNGVPLLFGYNAFLIASNGTESRVGSITADWERWVEWKRIEREDEPRRVSLEVMLRGTCDKARLLDLVENFTVFSELKAGLVKVLAQNHQFLGVNNTIASLMKARELGHGRGGVFWQTQGSGKSFSMVFFAQKVLRKLAGNWTFVVVTDRVELDDQIAKTFAACGAVTDAAESHAQSGAHLRELLRGNQRYVFTLIHKFQTPEMLCDRSDVIVMGDEAHRSQYDTLAVNMRSALPKAMFLAFTGTPLIAGEERTRDVFGDYVSIYDFQQSVEDGATVPLYYENRTPELRLENPDLNDDIYTLIESAELDPEQEKRLEREMGKQYHLITRDDRLETVAKDISTHFLGRGFQGKAMMVSIDKATAYRMYEKVRQNWAVETARVEKELKKLGAEKNRSEEILEQVRALNERLVTLKATDMAVIVSPSQNEIEQMRQFGIEVAPHRKRMNDEALDEKFKDPKDPLSLVFVCAMWLTGFDAPSCSTVYLDKPMRNHTLMQTIARANRVFPGKHSGLIVDYANVFASLEKALAIYGKGTGGTTPVKDKAKLVEELRKAIVEAQTYCAKHGVAIDAIEKATVGSLERLTALVAAVDALISPDAIRKEFLAQERWVATLYQAIKPDPSVLEFAGTAACLAAIAATIKERTGEGPPDISVVMADINRLLDDSIAADGFQIKEDAANAGRSIIDISKIDFEALANRFAKSDRKNVELEQLKAAIRAEMDKLIRLNRSRTDFLAKFEELIESYNAGSRNIDELFQQLLSLSRNLNEEQERHVRENLSEEELTVFDILVRPGPEMTTVERDEVKKVARLMLERVHGLLVLDWRQRGDARARVRLAIEDTLDTGLPPGYTKELYKGKCAALFEHLYENYQGEGESTYSREA